MRMIEFYKQYGEKTTKQAFGVGRKVISGWRKKFKESGGQLMALVPLSTRPHRVRRSNIDKEIIDFIRGLREKYPRLGKEKIKPLLDKHCQNKGLKSSIDYLIENAKMSQMSLTYATTAKVQIHMHH